ncbi:MAG: hypothetical protein HY259_14430 [Chloroflexi bacterium]|nr:hypothetical protein [Chloroflexota bacterium]MBI3734631.1 hypothetical protein [Chloroflexota bacterium]
MDSADYLLKLEQNIMIGSARFVADFAESFQDYRVGDVTFDLMIRGGTRLRQGILMSRAYSYFVGPNHFVSCFVHLGAAEGARFHALTRAVTKFDKDEEMTWAWLVIVNRGPFSRGTVRLAELWEKKEIGIALVDCEAEEISGHSNNYLGRTLAKHVKTFK